MAGLLIRLLGIGFALIQAALLIRLVLPFIDGIPRGLRPAMVTLIDVTDTLIAPFRALVQPFDLATIVDLGDAQSVLQAYVDRVDPAVVVAMIAWGLIGAVVMLALRLVFRPD